MGVDGLGHVDKAFRVAWLQRYRRGPMAWRVNTPLRDFEHKKRADSENSESWRWRVAIRLGTTFGAEVSGEQKGRFIEVMI